MSRILISGFYGFDNAGDEAVLAAMTQLLRERRADLDLVVLSAAPEATQRLHAVEAVPRMSRRAVGAALAACDLFVSGGGSLLQDATSARSAIYYLGLIYMAARMRKPVALYCQGIGPLHRPALRRLTRLVLNRASLITVRDEESARELQRLGVGRAVGSWQLAVGSGDTAEGASPRPPQLPTANRQLPTVFIAADPVFALRPSSEFEPARWLPPTPAGGWLGVSVRPWPGIDAMLPHLAEALSRLTSRTRVRPLLLPLQWDTDEPVCVRLRELLPEAAMLAGPGLDPRSWLSLIGALRGLVAMRLHALIFAASQGIPLAGIAYDPKITALLERLGSRPAATVAELNPACFAESVAACLDDAGGVQHQKEAAERMADAARQATELTLGLVDGAVA